jgi:hypothetical protein
MAVEDINEFFQAYEQLLWAEAKIKLEALCELPIANYTIDGFSYRTVGKAIRELLEEISPVMRK